MDLAKQIIRDVRLDLFEELAERYGSKVPPSFIASIFTNILKSLAREGVSIENIHDYHIEEVVKAIAEHKLPKDAVEDVLVYLARHPERHVKDAIKDLGITVVDTRLVEEIVANIINELRDEVREKGLRAMNKIMGRAMAKLRGKVDGKIVADIVRKKILELTKTQGS